MIKYYFTLSFVIVCGLLAHSQDYIKPTEGEIVVGDIIGIKGNHVEFKLVDEKDTTTYFMNKESLQSIGFYPSFTKDIRGISKGSEMIKSNTGKIKDYLILKDETVTPSNIDSIRNGNVYFHMDYDTTAYFIDKRNITAIVFSSTPVTFKKGQASNKPETTTLSASEMHQKGVSDARQYYKGYKGAQIASGIGAAFFLYGLPIPIITSICPPSESSLGYPDSELMRNPNYANGYRSTAHGIKAGKVWIGAGVGFAVLMGVVMFALVATGGH